jgi:hypothetical protein
MADIRYFYLRVLLAEAKMNGKNFDHQAARGLFPELSRLKQKSLQLNKEFAKLNGDYLQTGEIAEENELRNTKLNGMYAQITAILRSKE